MANYVLSHSDKIKYDNFTGDDIHQILQYIKSSYASWDDRVKTIRKENEVLLADQWNENNTYTLDILNENEYSDFADVNNFDAIISPSEAKDSDGVSYRETYNDYEIYCTSQASKGKLNFSAATKPNKNIKVNILYIYKPKAKMEISLSETKYDNVNREEE